MSLKHMLRFRLFCFLPDLHDGQADNAIPCFTSALWQSCRESDLPNSGKGWRNADLHRPERPSRTV